MTGTSLPPATLVALTDRQVSDLITRPLRILAIIVIALLLRVLAGRTITRLVDSTREGRVGKRLAMLGQRAPLLVDTSEAAIARRHQRAATVGAVLRSGSNVLIGAVAFATVVGELGINLAPIIASAGIVGVAVGFGAQNLVRDFLSGLFLVLEDTYGVGDVVDLGPAVGVVEAIGLRSTRIRDVHGSLWSVRNGEIVRVGNYSQSWQRALFDILLLPGQDVDAARTVMLDTAARVCAGLPEVALEQPEVWGVTEIRPDGVVLRMAVRRRPFNDAFDRRLREELVRALGAAGVRIFLLPADIHLIEDGRRAVLDLGRPGQPAAEPPGE